jgi:peptide/nickel transport system substrate-binding protein
MKRFRAVGGAAATVAAVLMFSGCSSGGTSGGDNASGGGGNGGTATVLMSLVPSSLDPQAEYTTQNEVVYTPLVTYGHTAATVTTLIPGLATALPVITNGGKTYTMTLRSGLKYSNGTPVKASDFTHSIERALKLNWGGDSFYTGYIDGASAYQNGRASTISGISTDDATGKITINLTTAYGAFANVLAFPASAPVPSTTPMKNLGANPPPGVGSYMFASVTPSQSYTLKKNPRFAGFRIPNIPAGHLAQINVDYISNPTAEAQKVLANQADSFDPGDTLPPSLVSQVEAQTSRFQMRTGGETSYFFLNSQSAPFNNQLAREAVVTGIDRSALIRLASGFGAPGCYLLPPTIIGHATAPCPYGDPAGHGDLAKARDLLKRSGEMGAKVTVWSLETAPFRQFAEYFASFLNQIGFKATPKLISDATYIQTIGNATTNPQAGFSEWNEDFPNPADFYLLLNAKSIQPANNPNLSKVNDPVIQKALAKLDGVPAAQLSSVASDWQNLESYVAKKAYLVPFYYQEYPDFLSDRINFKTAVFSPLFLDDWSTWQLNK